MNSLLNRSSTLDEAIRQMIEVEEGRKSRPRDSHLEIVQDPDIAGMRRSLNLTQKQMANLLDMPIGTLRNWEQGRRKPSNAGKLVLRLLANAPHSVPSAAAPDESKTADRQPTFGKGQLTEVVADQVGLSKSAVRLVIDATLDTIAVQLKQGADVRLSGFGRFTVAHHEAKAARNPSTGEFVEVPSRNIPKFKAGKKLKDAAG